MDKKRNRSPEPGELARSLSLPHPPAPEEPAPPAEPEANPAEYTEPAPPAEPGEALESLAEMDQESFAALMDQASGTALRRPKPGESVTGTVVRVDEDHAYLDVGDKAEARIALSELSEEEARLGARVTARVLRDGEDGLLLSRGRARGTPELLEDAYRSGMPLEGRVLSRNKGGYVVELGGFRAFCPVSQIDRYPGRDLDIFVGRTLPFRILELRGNEAVVSHRAVQEEEAARNRERIWDELQPGTVLDGVVTSVRDYGAFVDIGGVEGLVHRRELSWEPVRPEDFLKRWDRVRVRVLEVDRENRKISLSMKDPEASPWRLVGERFQEGGIYEGEVVRLLDVGALVELAPGLKGLVRTPNLSWDRVEHPSQVVKVGQKVRVKILSIDHQRQRLDLGLRQAQADPVALLAERYPPGTKVKGVVEEVSRKGLVVKVDGEVEAWLPARELDLPPGVLVYQRYRRGRPVEATVVEVDRRRRRLRLSQTSAEDAEEAEALRALRKRGPREGSLGTLGDLLGDLRIED